ncbi:hypothetical protein SETIT_8G159600v2 [Setaria italica]|uniref:Uncharacterized protein n=1 Tax=Setaria italica TaxID=4555 RepID=A0A368S8A1_SETIT|nr:hypothetical protein SETIT_8G159600v2 [Setaria italica]
MQAVGLQGLSSTWPVLPSPPILAPHADSLQPQHLLNITIPFCYFLGSFPHQTTPSTGASPPPPSCAVPPCALPSSKRLTPCWCAP